LHAAGRRFRNLSDRDRVVLTAITSGVRDSNDISLPTSFGERLDAFGPGAGIDCPREGYASG
jgi:hypothetical protein